MAKGKNTVGINMDIDDNGDLKRTGRDASKAGKDLKGMTDQAHSADRAMKGVSRQSSNTTKNFSKMSQGLTGGLVPAYATLAANIFALGAAFRFLKDAADYKLLLEGQKAYAAVSGVAYKTLTRTIMDATEQQITYADAAQAAAIGVAAGLSADQLTRLGEAAKLASIALGRDVGDAFNRLVRGTTKAEPELLDELGIILRLDTALEKYATKLGKSKEALTQFEKSQAITNDVLDQAEQKFGAIAKIMDPEVNQLNQMAKAFDDMTNSLKLFIAGPASALADFFSRNVLAASGALLLLAQPILKTLIPSYEEFKVKATASLDMHNEKLNQARIRAEAYAHSTTKMAAKARINYKNLSRSATEMSRVTTGPGAVGPGGGAGMVALQQGRELTPRQLARMRTSAAKAVGPFKTMHKEVLDDWRRTLDKMALEQAEYHTKSGTMLKKGKLNWDVFWARVQAGGQKAMTTIKTMQIGMMRAFSIAMSALTWASIGYMAFEGIREGINWLQGYTREAAGAESKISRLLSTQKDLNDEIKEMMTGAAALRDVKAGFGAYVEQAGRSFTSAAIGGNLEAIQEQRANLLLQQKGIMTDTTGASYMPKAGDPDFEKRRKEYSKIIDEIKRTEKLVPETKTGRFGLIEREYSVAEQATAIYMDRVKKYNVQMKDTAELEENLIERVQSMTGEYDFLKDVVKRMKEGNFELTDSEFALIEQYRAAGSAVTKLRDSTDKYNKTVQSYLGVTGNKHLNFLADVRERYNLMLEAVNDSTKGTEGHTKAVADAAKYKTFLTAVEGLTQEQIQREERIRQIDLTIKQDKLRLTGGTKFNAMQDRQNKILQNSIKIEGKLAEIRFLQTAEGRKQYQGEKGQEMWRSRIQQLRDEISVIELATEAYEKQDNVIHQLGNTFVKSFEIQMANAITSLVDGTATFSDAMKNMAKAVINAMIQIMAQMIAMRIIATATGMFAFGGPGVGVEQYQTMPGASPSANYVRDGGYITSVGKKMPLPSAAEGAVMKGPKSGYPAILHGKEYVLNEKQMGNLISGKKTSGVVNTTINVNMEGGVETTTDDQQTGEAFGKAIQRAVTEEIAMQQRPGGLLSPLGG